MAFSEVIPLDVVLSNRLGLYQVSLSNWGNLGASADQNSLVSPIFQFPLGGISIDPESSVERVVLRPVQNGFLNSSGLLGANDIPLDKDAPLTGRLSFPRINNLNGGWGLVAPQIDRWGDDFRQLDGSSVVFGGAVAFPATFVRPQLQLIMATDAGKPEIRVPRRYPLRMTDTFSTFTGPGTFDSILFVPVAGRKQIRIVTFQTAGAGAAALAIRGVTGARVVFPATFLDPVEFVLAPDLAVNPAGGNNVSVSISDPLCHYLHILGEGGVAASLTVYVEARD
jgi:hypothetical protein